MGFVARNQIFLDIIQKMIKQRVATGGMDTLLSKVKITNAAEGLITAEMKVDKEHANVGGTLHGAMTSFLVDTVSSLSLATCPSVTNTGVSVNLNMTFIRAAAIGEEIEIISKVNKAGGRMAFLSVDIVNKSTGELIATGSHTKYTAINRPESEIPR